MKIWERNGYTVVEKNFDHDLHEFEIVKDDEVIYTITPPNIIEMNAIIEALDEGHDVDGWEDGNGNTIVINPNPYREI